jgi:hypothetical protein
VATKTRRGPETSEVLKTFEDLNRGVCLSVTTNSAGQGQGQGRAGQGRGRGRAGQGRTAQNLFFCFFVLTKTTFFFFWLLFVPIKGTDEMSVRLDDETDLGEDQKKNI